ncbi:MAG TPA: hypothetical protein VJH20_00910 [Candidatus Nanoarchaeia archaeon]|nr:hypothetical protein [Candidatus Nanoarchaeia archaeon]
MAKDDYEIKFWKDWLYADHLKRLDMVEKLPITKTIWKMKDLPIKEHSFALMLNSFFEDLESAVYTKIRLEENGRKIKKP